ncbi:MAG: hypothetical protein ACFBQW_06975 [Sphingomonadaceae bacterium]
MTHGEAVAFFWDPLVLAAAVTASVGGVGGAITAYLEAERQETQRRHEKHGETCDRAFGYIQDDSLNPDIPQADGRRLAAQQVEIVRQSGKDVGND